jgi:hypothetical protein
LAEKNGILPRSALLFMAAVDEARRTNEGPFRAIAPIFRIALEPQRGQVLNVEVMTGHLSPIFGDNFTEHSLEAFLPHLVKMEWLAEKKLNDGKVVYWVPQSFPVLDEAKASYDSLNKLEVLHGEFQRYLDLHAPLLKFSLALDEFQWKLFRWATSLDGSDKAKVQAEADKLLSGEKPSIREAFLDEPQRFSPIDRGLSIEFAGFVKWLAANERRELADIASLTELGLALEFLQELRQPTSDPDLRVQTAFVLDAPVLLDLLGLSGPSKEASIKRCIAVLANHGAKFVTLEHCLEELSDILSTVLDRTQARRYGLTGDAMRSNPTLVGWATTVARQPDKAVRLAGVEVLVFDRRSPLNASFFPDPLLDEFRKSASWHDYYKTEQRDRDAMSVAFVMRRRQGRAHSEIFETPFALVVRNSTFTRFAERFVREHAGVPDYGAGPVIEVKTLAAVAWIRFGSDADPDLPQIQLISACDRILASNRELLRKAEIRLKELQGEDAAAVILGSQQAVLDLVISTGGNADVLTGADAEALLHALTTTAEERGRVVERRRAEADRDAIERALQARQEEVEALVVQASDSERLHRETSEALKKRERADNDRIEGAAISINEYAERVGSRIVAYVWIALTILAIFGQFFIWNGPDLWWESGPKQFLMGLAVITITLIAAAGGVRFLASGRRDLAGAVQDRLVSGLMRRRVSFIEPVEERNRILDELERRELL